jgi:CelD/BcsL family acetyltransferase involved in cellulose biosynthesis
MLRAEIIEDPAGLDGERDAWDALAVEAARPLATPAWMLAWWRHAAPPGAELRVVLAREGDELVGVAPYWARHGPLGFVEYQLLAAGSGHRLAPLAVHGRAGEVAAAAAGALSHADPRPATVRVDATDVDSPWPEALRGAWPGRLRPWVRCDRVLSAPVLELDGRGFDDWLQSKSKNFRQQMRGGRRKLEKAGARTRMSGPDELERDISWLASLHHERWSSRGGSSVMEPAMELLLLDAGRQLVESERFRLWLIELEGRPVSAHLFVAAGGEVAYWNGSFDPAFAQYKPALQTLLAAVEDAFERGDRRVDFGGGAQPYKQRFAESDHPIAWYTLFPRTSRYAITRAQTLPRHLRWGLRHAIERLPDDQRRRLKRLLGRDRGGES